MLPEQLPIERIQEVRPCFKCFDQFPRSGDSVITLLIQQAALLLFCRAELFGQFVAAGYKNVRINAALLLQHSEKLILTGEVRYLPVQLNDIRVPEKPAGADRLEVCNQWCEDLAAVMPELVVETAEGGVDISFWNTGDRTSSAIDIMVSANVIAFSVYRFLPGMHPAVPTIYDPRRRQDIDLPLAEIFFFA